MFIVDSYPIAVFFCFITMLCWGSWANTQKLAPGGWSLPLFYWDYVFGIVLLSLVFSFTLGSFGDEGRGFLADMAQGSLRSYATAFAGGVVFNLANVLVVSAIEIAGMAVAFPIGIGLALVIGVIINYLAEPLGDPYLLFLGVALVTGAIIFDAIAYNRLSSAQQKTPLKGILLSIFGGIFMGLFYRFVAATVSTNFSDPAAGMFTPYSAVFVFSIGILLSNFLWNAFLMKWPPDGQPVKPKHYVQRGSIKIHMIGILGGLIWCLGMVLNVVASKEAGFAISYGLGQGATMIATAWGVFIWKEFEEAPPGTNRLLALVFALFIIGLGLIVVARLN